MSFDAEEDGFARRDRLNSEGQYQLELNVLFVALSVCVVAVVVYICCKTLRNYTRATAALKRNENLTVTET